MSAALPDRLLTELGRTGGGPEALRLMVDDQHARRLVLFRALLDAAGRAPETVLPMPVADRLRAHWALLETADRVDRAAVRRVLFYPLAGPWLQRCLRGLAAAAGNSAAGSPAPDALPGLHRDLGHLGALAASAAARAGVPFTLRLPAHRDLLGLPTVGALRCAAPSAEISCPGRERGLTVTPSGGRAAPVSVRPGADGSWHSDDARWLPLHSLPGGPRPVLLDDLDPFRTVDSGLDRHGLGETGALTAEQRSAWDAVWGDVHARLRVGGEGRVTETESLLDCLVPLARPANGGADTAATGPAHCSGTRREAFGAVLSSVPDSSGALAATLVHELQHAKLAALGDLQPLHRADGRPRYWAPWRPDPRPFDGLLQGTYAHLALADYWQRCALTATDPARRDGAWAEHARCHAQVGAALPALGGSRSLTPAGRALVTGMAGRHAELRERPPPKGHAARAAAYVETARTMWRRQRTR